MTVAELKEALKYSDDEAIVSVSMTLIDHRLKSGMWEREEKDITVWQYENRVVIRT